MIKKLLSASKYLKISLILIPLFSANTFIYSQHDGHIHSDKYFEEKAKLKSKADLQREAEENEKYLKDFDMVGVLKEAESKNIVGPEFDQFIELRKKIHIQVKKSIAERNNYNPPLPVLACTNPGFEDGTLTGWTQYTGFNSSCTPNCTVSPGACVVSTVGAGTDACVPISTLAPGGGTTSVQLGNSITGGEINSIQQSFVVAAGQTLFTYQYAVVFNDPVSGHAASEMPYFAVDVSVNGATIPCGSYAAQYNTSGNDPSFVTFTTCGGGAYRNWTTVTVDLSAYVGQTVTMNYLVSDCGQGGHYGYAYLDFNCAAPVITPAPGNCSVNNTLTAPGGYATYSWTGPGIVGPANGQSINTNAPGTYTVSLTTAGGCVAPNITYVLTPAVPPTAAFTFATPACQNQATFDATTSVGTIDTYTWDFGDPGSGAANNVVAATGAPISHTFSAPGNYVVTLTTAAAGGCSNTITHNITITAAPTAAFTVNTPVCLGTANTFNSATSVAGAGAITNYAWDFTSNGSTDNTTANPTFTYPTAGTFNAQLIITNTGGCKDTLVVPVTVNAIPVAAFTYTPPVCSNNAIFVNNSTGSITTHDWNFGDATTASVATNATQNHTYATTGTFNVTLTVTAGGGCTNSVTQPVTIDAAPVASFTTNTPVCQGTAITFTSTSVATVGAITNYQWDYQTDGTPDGGNVASTSFVYPTAGTFNAQLIITNTAGCKDTATAVVVVNPVPTASFTFPAPNCTDVVNFTNTSSIPSGTITNFDWNFGDPGSGATNTLSTVVATNPSHTYSTTGNFTITLNVTGTGGCTHDTTMNVLISLPPVASFTHDAPVCFGTAVNFNSTSTPTVGVISTTSWDFTNDGTSDALGAAASNNYASANTYTAELLVINSFGCKDSITQTIIVNPMPVPSISANNVCLNVGTTFTNNTPVAPPVTSWHWDFGTAATNDTSNVQTPSYTYTAAGVYTVTLTAAIGPCSATVTTTDTVHPNPVAAFTAPNSCVYTTVNYNNTTPNPGPNDNIAVYNWNFADASSGANNSSALASPSHLFSADGQYNVTLIVTTNHGCKDTANSTITIFPKPVADFTSTTVCFGNNTTLTDGTTINGPDNIATYCWDVNTSLATCELNGVGPHNYPGLAGTYPISLLVTSNNGCLDTVTKTITVYPKPVANFTLTNVCDGVSSTFTNTSNETILNTEWDWTDDGVFDNTGTPTTHLYPVGTPGTFTVTMITTTNDGCKDTLSKPVTVHPNPVASFTSDSVCINFATTLTNTSTIGGPDVISNNNWDMNNDGSVEYFSPNSSHSFTPSGNHPVELMVVSNFGCKDSIVGNVFVHAAPVVNITSTPVCFGFPTTFNNTTTVTGGTIQQVDWVFGGPTPNTLTQVNPPLTATHAYPQAGTFTTTLTATSNAGCVTAGSILVTVHPKPVASFNYVRTCEGSLMNLNDLSTVTPTGAITAWDWSVDNAATASIAQNPSLAVGTPGLHNVTLISTTNNGCKDTITTPVYLNPNPVPSILGDDLAGCPTHCVNFTGNATNVPNSTITNWAWDFGNGLNSTLQNDASCYTSTSYDQNTLYDVHLTLTTDSGCVGTKDNLGYITVYPTPIADFTFAPTEPAPDINEPLVLFTNLSLGADHSYWNFGDAYSDPSLNTTTVTHPQHFYYSYDPHDYVVTLAVDNNYGCVDTIRKTVEIKPDFSFFIPNAFSPNGDGVNDGFNGKGIGIDKYEIWIFDRWGNMIWYADSLDKLWDGKVQGKDEIVLQDVYVWKVKFKDILSKKHEYHGTVTVVR